MAVIKALTTRGKILIAAPLPKNASTTMMQSRIKVWLKAGTDIRLVYAHYNGIIANTATSITVQASIEQYINDTSTAGTIYRAYTGASYDLVVTQPTYASEFPVPGFTQYTDGWVWVRTCVTFTAGDICCGGLRITSTGVDRWSMDAETATYTTNNPVDSTNRTTGGGFVSANLYDIEVYTATTIVGTPTNMTPYVPAVIWHGDSITDLFGTATNKWDGWLGDQLLQITASGGIHPFWNGAINGDTVTARTVSGNKRDATEAMYPYFDVCVIQSVVNDFRGARTYAQVSADVLTVAGRAQAQGLRTGACTCTANTTGAWTSDALQTGYYNSKFGIGDARDSYNGDLRTNGTTRAGLQFYLDGSVYVEGGIPQKWSNSSGVADTADGLHSNNTLGGPKMVAAVVKTKFYPDDTTAPTVSSAVISTSGTTITFTFSEAMSQLAGVAGLSFSYNGGSPLAPTYGIWTGPTTLVVVLPYPATSTNTVKWSYDTSTGGLVDLAVPANELATNTNSSTTNNSTATGGSGGVNRNMGHIASGIVSFGPSGTIPDPKAVAWYIVTSGTALKVLDRNGAAIVKTVAVGDRLEFGISAISANNTCVLDAYLKGESY